MTRYFRIGVRLEVRITSLVGRLLPYITDDVFPVFLLAEQTPAELIVVALTQLDYQGEELLDKVIDTLEMFFITTMRCYFDEGNIDIALISQSEFYKAFQGFEQFIDSRYFEND